MSHRTESAWYPIESLPPLLGVRSLRSELDGLIEDHLEQVMATRPLCRTGNRETIEPSSPSTRGASAAIEDDLSSSSIDQQVEGREDQAAVGPCVEERKIYFGSKDMREMISLFDLSNVDHAWCIRKNHVFFNPCGGTIKCFVDPRRTFDPRDPSKGDSFAFETLYRKIIDASSREVEWKLCHDVYHLYNIDSYVKAIALVQVRKKLSSHMTNHQSVIISFIPCFFDSNEDSEDDPMLYIPRVFPFQSYIRSDSSMTLNDRIKSLSEEFAMRRLPRPLIDETHVDGASEDVSRAVGRINPAYPFDMVYVEGRIFVRESNTYLARGHFIYRRYDSAVVFHNEFSFDAEISHLCDRSEIFKEELCETGALLNEKSPDLLFREEDYPVLDTALAWFRSRLERGLLPIPFEKMAAVVYEASWESCFESVYRLIRGRDPYRGECKWTLSDESIYKSVQTLGFEDLKPVEVVIAYGSLICHKDLQSYAASLSFPSRLCIDYYLIDIPNRFDDVTRFTHKNITSEDVRLLSDRPSDVLFEMQNRIIALVDNVVFRSSDSSELVHRVVADFLYHECLLDHCFDYIMDSDDPTFDRLMKTSYEWIDLYLTKKFTGSDIDPIVGEAFDETFSPQRIDSIEYSLYRASRLVGRLDPFNLPVEFSESFIRERIEMQDERFIETLFDEDASIDYYYTLDEWMASPFRPVELVIWSVIQWRSPIRLPRWQ